MCSALVLEEAPVEAGFLVIDWSEALSWAEEHVDVESDSYKFSKECAISDATPGAGLAITQDSVSLGEPRAS